MLDGERGKKGWGRENLRWIYVNQGLNRPVGTGYG